MLPARFDSCVGFPSLLIGNMLRSVPERHGDVAPPLMARDQLPVSSGGSGTSAYIVRTNYSKGKVNFPPRNPTQQARPDVTNSAMTYTMVPG